MTHKSSFVGPSARLQKSSPSTQIINYVSFVWQVCSAVISQAGHKHTQRGQGHWLDWALQCEITCHTNSNHVSPREHAANFPARSITDQFMWLCSAAGALLTVDCVERVCAAATLFLSCFTHLSLFLSHDIYVNGLCVIYDFRHNTNGEDKTPNHTMITHIMTYISEYKLCVEYKCVCYGTWINKRHSHNVCQ